MPTEAAILLVDDDQDVCASLADVLTDFGYGVRTALSGDAALRLLRDQAFQVALLDYSMPDMNGLELYQKIQQVRPGLVGVFVTAYADTELMDAVRAAGVEHIFAKPVDFARLFALLEGQIGKPA
jgi:two-component system response regulator HydG